LNNACKTLAEKGYEGLSQVAGIPGTAGGAIYMNASASHGAISDSLIDVEAYNKDTRERKVFTKTECRFGFRTSIFQNSPWIILFIRFQLKKGDKDQLLSLCNKIKMEREKNYPLTFPSAGCWFRRDWGGKEIIEKIGMSGMSEGRAVVSPMFPAFILNTGGATAKDIYSLVRQIQDKAKEINEEMPCEIVVWGEI
jgi:UDP-N-acetylmuramate dehydrogenase